MGDDHKITPPPGGEGVSKSNTAWHSTRKMIFVKNKCGSGFWPIPESFWPDTHTVTLVRGHMGTLHWGGGGHMETLGGGSHGDTGWGVT